ncbi:MAG TPA: hypothetical protein VJX66_01235 [Amycolatopsis sp.]|nr:hypothetical protein [Amycolatopsis sp.]
MKTIRWFPFVLAGAITACGGGLTTDDYRANALTFDKVAIAQNDADTAAPAMQADSANPGAELVDATTCHPHLFERTGEVIGRVNRHFFKLVRHIGDLIEDNPKLSSGGSKTWENVKGGIDRKLTVTATTNADGSVTYDFELDIKSTGDFVKVASGSLTHTGPAAADVTDAGAAVRVENKGSATFDFDALASVVTTEKARGQISDAFDNVRDPAHGVKRSANITLTNFLPEEGDAHGPRTGGYSWLREPGVGGMFSFQESVVLLCPSNPNNLAADVTTVARWYKASDGGVHGRSDSKATGGQIASGSTWIGMTCAQGQTTAAPAEGEWLMKDELSNGDSDQFQVFTSGVSPCDPLFGAIPDQHDATNDYDFSKPVTFPGEWQ